MASPAKRKVICAGRRSGKTEMATLMAIRNDENRLGLAYGSQVLITSTTQDQADVSWRRLKNWLRPLIDNHDASKNESHRVIEWGDGRVRVKTGWDADVLRGEDADLLILDECARLDPMAWYEVGAPMLADRDGTAVLTEATFSLAPQHFRSRHFPHQHAQHIAGSSRFSLLPHQCQVRQMNAHVRQ